MCDEKVEDLGSLPNGCRLSRRKNGAGGYTYYSDEIGGGVLVWDTCLVKETTLFAAISCEHCRRYEESMRNQGHEIHEMRMEEMAATGGFRAKPKSNAICRLCEKEFYIFPELGSNTIVCCPFCNANNTIALAKTRLKDPTQRRSFLENQAR